NPDKTAKDVTIACFGLAFKPDIDDLRESPALMIAERILSTHAGGVMIVEPNVASLPAKCLLGGALVSTTEAISTADILLLLVDHQSFKALGRQELQDGLIVDCRGIWDLLLAKNDSCWTRRGTA